MVFEMSEENKPEWVQQTPVTVGQAGRWGGCLWPCMMSQLQTLGFLRVTPGLGHSGSSGRHVQLPMRMVIAMAMVWGPKGDGLGLWQPQPF